MQTYRALLIGNGEAVSPRLLKALAKQAGYVLAADGGADLALRAGIIPDVVIGDLDSVSPRAKKQLAARLKPVATQENTDLEKALRFALNRKFTHLTLVGFVGNRWDFSIGNLLALAKYARKLNITLAGDKWRMYLLSAGQKFACQKNKRVSIIPLKACHSVTLKGLKYPLTSERLSPGTTRTLSNQTTSTQFEIFFEKGCLLVYLEV